MSISKGHTTESKAVPLMPPEGRDNTDGDVLPPRKKPELKLTRLLAMTGNTEHTGTF